MKPQHSETLQAKWDALMADGSDILTDYLTDSADSCCTNGFDNDSSTGHEIFENGYDLAERAAGRPVFFVGDDEQNYFFIGTEEEISVKLDETEQEARSAEDDQEESDEDDPEPLSDDHRLD